MRAIVYISMQRVNTVDYNVDGDDINASVYDDDADYLISIWITQILYQCRCWYWWCWCWLCWLCEVGVDSTIIVLLLILMFSMLRFLYIMIILPKDIHIIAFTSFNLWKREFRCSNRYLARYSNTVYLITVVLRTFIVSSFTWYSRQFVVPKVLFIPSFIIIQRFFTNIFTIALTIPCLLYILITSPNNFHDITFASFKLWKIWIQ